MPFDASWLNRIEAQFTAWRYFTLDGTDHESHQAQARMIRGYIAGANCNADDPALRELVKRDARAGVAPVRNVERQGR